MPNMDFEWQIEEFMVDCRSRQLRPKTMNSYEQALRLFARWCRERMNITEVTDVTESVVRRYINDLQERGKYTVCADDRALDKNFPDRRRDFRKPGLPEAGKHRDHQLLSAEYLGFLQLAGQRLSTFQEPYEENQAT